MIPGMMYVDTQNHVMFPEMMLCIHCIDKRTFMIRDDLMTG